MAKEVLVIGGGPGGYAAAIYSAKLGQNVTLVEKDKVGGTCLNRGCIPTKAFLHAAGQLREIKAARTVGITAGEVAVDFAKTAKFKNKTVTRLRGGVEFLLKKNKVQVVPGTARLLDAKTAQIQPLEGEPYTLAPDAIVLATGSRETVLPGFEPDGVTVLNSTQMLDITEMPESMIIIGGGVIGVEFASVLAGFGKKVTIVEYAPRLLPGIDHDASDTLRMALEAQGIEVLTEASAKAILKKGAEGVSIGVEHAGETKELSAEKLLVCIGRKANIEGIGLEEAEVQHDGRYVLTGGDMRTNVPHIYAVGDITASPQLAHVAYHEANVAAKNIAGELAVSDYRAVPGCIYSHPEVACVGLSEEAARESMEVEVEIQPFSGNGKAMIEQQTEGFVKMVYGKETGRLVGCAIVGPKATELICEPTLAVHAGFTVKNIADTIHAHPSLGELLGETAEAAIGHGLHSV